MAAMVGELEKMKVPYKVGADGTSLLVPEPAVHKTRLSLMGRELPLHGAVGFELFNNMEFGVSEFVQKVNYQRALQGELTRTILAIDEVQSARVHLAMPEQSLFRKESGKSKASVTLTTKPGRSLQPSQVQGIQRLVAASVPEIQPQDVTVLDQHGVALSRAAPADAAMADAGGSLLDSKRSVEGYLAQKAAKVLDRLFGAGESVVSVDAVLSQDQTRVTTEEVLPARGGEAGQASAGVVVRERQSTKDAGGDAAHAGATVTNTETEYQTGKRVEQVVSPAGSLKQLNVAVVVKRPLAEDELQRIRALVAASVGANAGRGDTVTVHSMQQLQEQPKPSAALEPAETAAATAGPQPGPSPSPAVQALPAWQALAGLLLLAVLGAASFLALRARRPAVVSLSEAERVRLLHTVQQWMADGLPSGSRQR
jgi:flagellar M-ring protein FliF